MLRLFRLMEEMGVEDYVGGKRDIDEGEKNKGERGGIRVWLQGINGVKEGDVFKEKRQGKDGCVLKINKKTSAGFVRLK